MSPYRPTLIACFIAFACTSTFPVADAQEAATGTSSTPRTTVPVVRTNTIKVTSPAPGQVVGVHTGMLQVQVKVVGALEDDETSVTARAIGDDLHDYGPYTLGRIGSTNYFGGPILVPASADGEGFQIRAEAVFANGPPGVDPVYDYIGIDLDAEPTPEETRAVVKAASANIQDDCRSDRIEITRPLKRERVHVNEEGKIFVQLKALDPAKPGSDVFAEAMTYDDPDEGCGKEVLVWNEDLKLYEGWIEAPHSDTEEGARFLIKGEVDFPDDGKPHRCIYHGPIFGLDK
jgi:hypothetical protein